MKVTRFSLALLNYPGTQHDLSLALHTTPSRISEYKTGHRQLPKRHLIAVSTLLRVPPADLIGTVDVDPLQRGRK